jgi:hypothetical protein
VATGAASSGALALVAFLVLVTGVPLILVTRRRAAR